MHLLRTSVAGLAVLLAVSTAARAQNLCPKESNWVTGKPRWWDVPGDPAEWRDRPRLDPGWTGAAAASFFSSVDQGGFRAIVAADPSVNPAPGGKVLFVTWQMDQDWFGIDPATCNNPNARVFFAVADAASPSVANTRVFRLDVQGRVFTSTTVPTAFACDNRVPGVPAPAGCAQARPQCDPANGIDVPGNQTFAVFATNGDPTAPALVPNGSLTDGAAFLAAQGAIWKDSASTWTVNLAIPINDPTGFGVPFAGAFKAYFEVRNCTQGEGNNSGICTVERWPRATTVPSPPGTCTNGGTQYVCHPGGSFATIALPPYADWGTIDPTATCTAGVNIGYDDVGVVHDPTLNAGATDTSDPASYTFNFQTATLTSVFYGKRSGTPARNVIVARPYNGTGARIEADQLTAHFRIADWGSMADIGTDRGAWNVIPGEPAPPAGNPVANRAGFNNTEKGTIIYQWQLTDQERCDYGLEPPGVCATPSVKSKDDQCLLVTLRGKGRDFEFVTDSVYRNMRFISTSRWEDDATLSTEDIPDLKDGRRPSLYLHVTRRQLPYQAEYMPAADVYNRLQDVIRRYRQGNAAHAMTTTMAGHARALADLNPDRLRGQVDRQQKLYDLIARLPVWIVREVMPTVDYTVFRETDDVIQDADGTYRVAVPQPGFGVFARHLSKKLADGRFNDQVFGWATAIRGRARRLSESWYRVDFKTKQDQVVLKTIVQSLESAYEPRAVDVYEDGPDPDDPACAACASCDSRCKGCPGQPCPPNKGGIPRWIWILIGVLGVVIIYLGARAFRARPPAV